uniref:Terminase n=1 Tax=viral metagenome TaxID=1070528 RepID=A0A6M3ITU5_9ZZZZ
MPKGVKKFNITPPPKRLAEEERAIEIGRTDLIAFGKLFLRGDFCKADSAPYQYEIADAYMDKSSGKQLAVIIPRGHIKSTLTKAFILQQFLYHPKNEPPLFFAWVADRLDKAYRNMDYIDMQIRFNTRLIHAFGDMCGKTYNRKWTEHDKVFRNSCTLVSRSNIKNLRGETAASVIGGSQRYNRVILDDIENEENTKTLDSIDVIKRVITNAIYPALDVNSGRLIFNGTPVHPTSFCQSILDGYNKAIKENRLEDYSWQVITYAATQPDMQGGVLWHAYYPREKLDEIRLFYVDTYGNDSGYFQEYELQPQAKGAKVWGAEHYQIHNVSYQWDEKLHHSFLNWHGDIFPVNCFLGCDPATDINTRGSDRSVITVVAVDKDWRIFVMEEISKLSIPEIGMRDKDGNIVGDKGVVDYIIDLYDAFHCKNGTLEDVAMTRGVWQSFQAEKLRSDRYDIVLRPEKPAGREKRNKIVAGLGKHFYQRKIYLRQEHFSLRHQIENMGPKLGHDDEVEALFFATRNMYVPVLEKTEKSNTYVEDLVSRSRSWIVR